MEIFSPVDFCFAEWEQMRKFWLTRGSREGGSGNKGEDSCLPND